MTETVLLQDYMTVISSSSVILYSFRADSKTYFFLDGWFKMNIYNSGTKDFEKVAIRLLTLSDRFGFDNIVTPKSFIFILALNISF